MPDAKYSHLRRVVLYLLGKSHPVLDHLGSIVRFSVTIECGVFNVGAKLLFCPGAWPNPLANYIINCCHGAIIAR